MELNEFHIKQQFPWYNRKVPYRTLAAVQTVTADTVRFVPLFFFSVVFFFFPILLQSLKHIASRPPPLSFLISVMQHVKQEKTGQDNAARCSNVGESGHILFAAVGSPLQSGRGSAKQSSVSINQSQRCSPLWKCWRSFSLSSYLLDWWCVLSPGPAVRCHYWLTTTLVK